MSSRGHQSLGRVQRRLSLTQSLLRRSLHLERGLRRDLTQCGDDQEVRAEVNAALRFRRHETARLQHGVDRLVTLEAQLQARGGGHAASGPHRGRGRGRGRGYPRPPRGGGWRGGRSGSYGQRRGGPGRRAAAPMDFEDQQPCSSQQQRGLPPPCSPQREPDSTQPGDHQHQAHWDEEDACWDQEDAGLNQRYAHWGQEYDGLNQGDVDPYEEEFAQLYQHDASEQGGQLHAQDEHLYDDNAQHRHQGAQAHYQDAQVHLDGTHLQHQDAQLHHGDAKQHHGHAQMHHGDGQLRGGQRGGQQPGSQPVVEVKLEADDDDDVAVVAEVRAAPSARSARPARAVRDAAAAVAAVAAEQPAGQAAQLVHALRAVVALLAPQPCACSAPAKPKKEEPL